MRWGNNICMGGEGSVLIPCLTLTSHILGGILRHTLIPPHSFLPAAQSAMHCHLGLIGRPGGAVLGRCNRYQRCRCTHARIPEELSQISGSPAALWTCESGESAVL